MTLNLNERSNNKIMIVKCMYNAGKDLPEETLKIIHFSTTIFQLNIGNEYPVYGIAIWKGILNYLTMDKYLDLPSWHPADLFEIVDSELPYEWHHKYYGFTEGVHLNAIWGYKELVQEEEHYTELIEREDTAISIFLKRKKEFEEYSQ